MADTATRVDRLKAAHAKLEDAIAELVSGEDWKRMLNVASKFHRYSFNNHLLGPHSIGPPSRLRDHSLRRDFLRAAPLHSRRRVRRRRRPTDRLAARRQESVAL